MNLLRVIASMDPAQGGPCQGIRNSIPELGKFGVYNEVVSLDDPEAMFLHKDYFVIQAIGPSSRPWCYSSKLIPWLLDNLGRFDAVIIHGLWLYHGYAVRKAIQILKLRKQSEKGIPCNIPKVFVMPHGMLDPYFQRAKGRKLKAVRNWLYWKLIEGNVVNEADGVLFTCEAELQLARNPFRPYHPKQERNVSYGIANPPTYEEYMQHAFLQKCSLVVGSPYILFLSRIHEKKGVDLLIKAYAQILKKALISKAASVSVVSTEGEAIEEQPRCAQSPKLVIAGPGLETPYGQHILKMVGESPELRESVFFPGMLTGDAKWGAFYGCDAFVLPSHQENFGIAVVEALACGKPVLITNQVNIWREIEAVGGGMVADDTLAEIKDMLERWEVKPFEERVEMSLQAKNCYEKFFAIGPSSQQLLQAINAC